MIDPSLPLGSVKAQNLNSLFLGGGGRGLNITKHPKNFSSTSTEKLRCCFCQAFNVTSFIDQSRGTRTALQQIQDSLIESIAKSISIWNSALVQESTVDHRKCTYTVQYESGQVVLDFNCKYLFTCSPAGLCPHYLVVGL